MTSICAPSGAWTKATRLPLLPVSSSRISTPLPRKLRDRLGIAVSDHGHVLDAISLRMVLFRNKASDVELHAMQIELPPAARNLGLRGRAEVFGIVLDRLLHIAGFQMHMLNRHSHRRFPSGYVHWRHDGGWFCRMLASHSRAGGGERGLLNRARG